MKKSILACTIAALLVGHAHAAEAPAAKIKAQKVAKKEQEPTIRVLIAKDINGALLEVKGSYSVISLENGEVLSSGKAGKRFVVQTISEGLRWGEEFPLTYQIKITPRSEDTLMYINGMQYKGSLAVYHTSRGLISIVNEVAIEDYIKSTLSTEINTTLSQEALASLTIASRTMAYVKAFQSASKGRLYDVAAADVKYYGMGVTMQAHGIDQVVEGTKHIVLLQGKNPVREIPLSAKLAEQLAAKGYDAKKILTNLCPDSTLSVVQSAPEANVQR